MRNPSIVLHYRVRADSLFRAARDLSTLDAELYGPALGVIAVHGAIALADAVLVACEGDRSRSEDSVLVLGKTYRRSGHQALRMACGQQDPIFVRQPARGVV